MRLLTNFALELFGARADYPFDAILSFGPAAGRKVGQLVVPYDIPFDAGEESFEQLIERTAGFAPDAIVFFWPDQDPLPEGLEDSPIPTIAVVSDYNLTLPLQRGLWPYFDLVLCDHSALPVFGRLPFAAVEPWCQFSFRPDVHRVYDETRDRDLDVTFLGNLHPVIQRTRLPWLERLDALADRFRVHIGQVEQGRPYGEVLARSKIAFNRSVRGEVNLRCFEAAACGALVFCERENLEVRDYFDEDREVVLYGPDDFERKLVWYLEHDDARRRLAEAGRRRVEEHRLAELTRPLPERIARLDVTRRPRADDIERKLALGESRILARCSHASVLRPLREAADAAPSARTLTALACALATRVGEEHEAVLPLARTAHEADPQHAPSLANLARLEARSGAHARARALREQLEELSHASVHAGCFDGLVLPIGFQSRFVAHSAAYADSIRRLELAPLRQFFGRLARDEKPDGPMPEFEPALDVRSLVRHD